MNKYSSNLLINEHPILVLPSLVMAIGLNEAIIIQQLHYWLNNSSVNGVVVNGEKWIYNTYEEWQETNFPFWSLSTIKRTFLSLEEIGLIISIKPESNKYYHRKAYRIDYEALNKLSVSIDSGQSIMSKRNDYSGQFDMHDGLNLSHSLNESETTAKTTTENTNSAQNLQEDRSKMNDDEIETPENKHKRRIKSIVHEQAQKGLSPYFMVIDDDIKIENAQQPLPHKTWSGREKIPNEHVMELLDKFVELTGITPTPKQLSVWISTGNEWLLAGINTDDLERAYKYSLGNEKKGGFIVTRPSALTSTAQRFAGLRKTGRLEECDNEDRPKAIRVVGEW